MTEINTPIVETEMLIRKPPTEVFEAFINPELTQHFWFTRSSDKLQLNKEIEWHWDMYGISTKVKAIEIIPNQLIVFDWYSEVNKSTQVRMEFMKYGEFHTMIRIQQAGFHESGDELIQTIKDSTGGFTMVLSGLKAYLEHGINLNLIADKAPDHVSSNWKK